MTGFLNGLWEKTSDQPRAKILRCSNTIGRCEKPDQWRIRTLGLDLMFDLQRITEIFTFGMHVFSSKAPVNHSRKTAWPTDTKTT